ncbi:hypothetical protein ILYODFUR_030939, partial [Ilyodon furcidens]
RKKLTEGTGGLRERLVCQGPRQPSQVPCRSKAHNITVQTNEGYKQIFSIH